MEKAINNEYFQSKSYPISWIQVGKKNIFLGICHYSHKIFTISSGSGMGMLTLLVVNNLYISEKNKQCEEGKRCLNIRCPFNQTTYNSYALSKGWKIKKGEAGIKEWNNWTNKERANIPELDWSKSQIIVHN